MYHCLTSVVQAARTDCPSAVSLARIVSELIRTLPDKSCLSEPLPTWLLKKNVNVLAPFLCQLFNRSLERGIVPPSFKSGYITPLLKKAALDANDKSYKS